jgi:hypothetical protein
MTNITQDLWTGDSTWRIVGADLDLQHVFIPASRITFTAIDGGFRVAPVGPTSTGDCFRDTFLRRVGSRLPSLNDVEGLDTLADFETLDAKRSSDVLDTLATHVDQNEDLLHLEGMITILCHETADQLRAPPTRPAHAPLRVETKICVYQINDAGAKGPFLLIRAPFSPTCPLNGNGTVGGQA